MAFLFNENFINLINQLVKNISGFEENSEECKRLVNFALVKIKNSETISYITKKDIDDSILSFSDKFVLHGYWNYSQELLKSYQKFINTTHPKQNITVHLEIVKLLLCLSEKPTIQFLTNPPDLPVNKDETIIDWGAYLKDGAEDWYPCESNSESEWSDAEDKIQNISDTSVHRCTLRELAIQPALVLKIDPFMQVRESRETMTDAVQSYWWNKRDGNSGPVSEVIDANVALIWNDYCEHITHGLVPKQYLKIVSEYKCIREVLWQFYKPHNSCLFCFRGNEFCIRNDVSISSVRAHKFSDFIKTFLPDINLAFYFNSYLDFITKSINNYNSTTMPDTYINYAFGIQAICNPIYSKLREIEKEVQDQKNIYTILKLARDINLIFNPLRVLKNIHTSVLEDYQYKSPCECAILTLTRLHRGISNCYSKCEFDIYLSLYLESVKKFLTITDTWLNEDKLVDSKEEFIILEQPTQSQESEWELRFIVKTINEDATVDPFLSTICDYVLLNAKNIHLLRRLGNLQQLVNITGPNPETIYEEFVRNVLKEIATFFNLDDDHKYLLKKKEYDQITPKRRLKSLTSLDEKLPNFQCNKELGVQICFSDMLLMKAFQWRMDEKQESAEKNEDFTLFERIRNITQGFFPVQQLMANVLKDIIKNRFSVSGILLKSVLMEKYKLNGQFQLLQHIYMFNDDLLSPIYRKMFNDFGSSNMWGNFFYMTSRLQDLLSDIHPEFYEHCRVEVDQQWKQCKNPILACQMIKIDYKIQWPINIFVQKEHVEMYHEIFHVILKIKWALYTLNHLSFSDIEPRSKKNPNYRYAKRYGAKLKLLRFWLISDWTIIQHYILGYIYKKHAIQFEKELSEAFDVDTLIKAHSNFIKETYESILGVCRFNENSYGFNRLLVLVYKLANMWDDLQIIDREKLEAYERDCKKCHNCLNSIVYIPEATVQ